jgi:hypothetical protein
VQIIELLLLSLKSMNSKRSEFSWRTFDFWFKYWHNFWLKCNKNNYIEVVGAPKRDFYWHQTINRNTMYLNKLISNQSGSTILLHKKQMSDHSNSWKEVLFMRYCSCRRQKVLRNKRKCVLFRRAMVKNSLFTSFKVALPAVIGNLHSYTIFRHL